jgi:ammonia channel protein AmtB
LILLILHFTIGIRLSAEEQLRGLDWIGKSTTTTTKDERRASDVLVFSSRRELGAQR